MSLFVGVVSVAAHAWVFLGRLMFSLNHNFPLLLKSIRWIHNINANSIIVAITNDSDTKRYIPKALNMAPDGLVDCKKRNWGAIQRSLKQHYIGNIVYWLLIMIMFLPNFLTMFKMKILVNVRNWVTTSPTRPGTEDRGMIKLIWDTTTIAREGK